MDYEGGPQGPCAGASIFRRRPSRVLSILFSLALELPGDATVELFVESGWFVMLLFLVSGSPSGRCR
ncbi:hypothetical protein JTE90_020937 [Oedothorax gibbosus]|uniref:Uncharacterized protein n=1 Tax=Oedothorax gibbosus TaxID=931172 RepID=A0AAV6VQV8_9ARAC|nr:hypothetical protein JTE90_020937 [Oedothorax gibbosus]